MAALRIKRGTRAQIDAAASASGLAAGEPYLITDEDRIAAGLSATAYQAYAKQGESPTFALIVTAGETIAAGNLVHLYTDTGALKVQKADASGTTKPANGFTLAEITSGNSGTVYTGGVVTGLSSLTPGGDCWLSQSSAGGVTQSAPNEATTGKIIQLVGKALTASTMALQLGPAIIT